MKYRLLIRSSFYFFLISTLLILPKAYAEKYRCKNEYYTDGKIYNKPTEFVLERVGNKFKESYEEEIHYHEIGIENETFLTLIQTFDSYPALFAIFINKATKEQYSNYLSMDMDKKASPLGSYGKCQIFF